MERHAASLLILSGPPGAGKSTVAPLVAADADPSVRLESDWFWTTFVNGFVEPWLPAEYPFLQKPSKDHFWKLFEFRFQPLVMKKKHYKH